MGPSTCNFEYELLVDVLKDFSKTSMRGLTHTLIALSNNFTLKDNEKNLETITMKCNMKGDMTYMNENPKEYPVDQMQWNIDNLVTALKEVYAGKDWTTDIVKFLDVDIDARDEYYFQSQEAFDVFIKIWSLLKPPNKPIPVDAWIEKVWKNKKAQVICLDYAINYSYENSEIPFEKAKRRQDIVNNLQNIKSSASNYMRVWK